MGLTTAGVKIHDDWWPQNSFKDVSWICNKNLNIGTPTVDVIDFPGLFKFRSVAF